MTHLQEECVDLRALPLDDEYAYHISNRNNTSVRMGTLLFESEKFRRIRLTHYDGGDMQVLNCLWYPRPQYDAPLLGVNLVSFGSDKKQLCVVDFQPLEETQNESARPLVAIQEKFPALNETITAKFYDQQFFSPYLLLGRFDKISELLSVGCQATELAVKEYMKLVMSLPVDEGINAERRKLRQNDYNKYNAERDPSLGIYEVYFGKSWAKAYINNVKFG
eukprot:CAMPEP_0167741406 /NCGR_PEP_ID=MMETSP0110_2-20121227/842_1 /TAXON_ID=629695 /ORGANISM="Gymnochlora sp., Strain CCMP2014" /LENGTH=220 /DNA_ID=CAMNT_0007625461 /DNA_START=93 /DNA_END=755 /DNA_ORIENTATION=-